MAARTVKIILALVLVTALAGLYFFWYGGKRGDLMLEARLKGFSPVDMLFTSSAYVPVLESARGPLKRTLGLGRDVVKGYCYKQYEVGIGYRNVLEFFGQYRNEACTGSFEELPEPEILTVNAFDSENFGIYSSRDCDEWDVLTPGKKRPESHYKVFHAMVDDGYWPDISKRGKEVLGAFLSVYCDV